MSKKKELERAKKISKLKEFAGNVAKSAAGIALTGNPDTFNNAKKEINKEKVVGGLKGAATAIGTGGIAGAMANRDKGIEEKTVKRYNSAPASNSSLNVKDGIISKGNFNSGSKKREDEERKRRAAGFR